jgi:hypothetical protein
VRKESSRWNNRYRKSDTVKKRLLNKKKRQLWTIDTVDFNKRMIANNDTTEDGL